MAVIQHASFGDSTTSGDTGSFDIAEGAMGAWVELVPEALANLGVGPIIGAGFRGVWRTGTGEWSRTGSWTQTVSTDAFDKALHGQAWYASNGTGSTTTFTKPALWRPIVGFCIEYIDYASGGDFQYRIDGGTWTNMGQSPDHLNGYKRFYVASSVTSTVDFRAFNGTTSCGVLVAGIEPFFVDPRTAGLSGLIWHNIASNAHKLHDAVAVTSGDRLAWFDNVTCAAGTPARTSSMTTLMFINDVLNADTAAWGVDLTTAATRLMPLGALRLMSLYEANLAAYAAATQAAYRAQTKTTASALGLPAPLDFFDIYVALGFGIQGTQVAALIAAGYTNVAGDFLPGTHPSAAGHADIYYRIYQWLIANAPSVAAVVTGSTSTTIDRTRLATTGQTLRGSTDLRTGIGGAAPARHIARPRPPGKVAPAGVGFAPRVAHAGDQQQATPTGIASTVALGVPTLTNRNTISPTGIASTVVVGDSHPYNVPYPQLFIARPRPPGRLSPGGVGFAPRVTHTKDQQSRTVIGIGPSELIGVPAGSTILAVQPLTVTGIASTVAFGGPSVTSGTRISPTGIGPNERIGKPFGHSLVGVLTAAPTGIASTVTFGNPTLAATSASQLLPTGIAAGEKVGKPAATSVIAATPPQATILHLRPPGRVSPGGLGFIRRTQPTTRTTQTISPSGIPPNGVYVNPAGDPYTTEAADAYYTVEQYPTIGVPTLTLQLKVHPTGIASTVTLGVPAVGSTYRLRPTGIGSTAAFGVPALHGGQTAIRPTGIGSTVRFGVISGQAPHPTPTGIASTVMFGVPRLSIAATWNVEEARPRWTVGYPHGRWSTRDPATAS